VASNRRVKDVERGTRRQACFASPQMARSGFLATGSRARLRRAPHRALGAALGASTSPQPRFRS
jgi:hypothetical protein